MSQSEGAPVGGGMETGRFLGGQSLEQQDPRLIEEIDAEILGRIPVNGAVGNARLIKGLESLGWNAQDYWVARQRLIDRGVLRVGRGRGGSVARGSAWPASLGIDAHNDASLDDSSRAGATLHEFTLRDGGRYLAVVTGSPDAEELGSIHARIRAHYAASDSQESIGKPDTRQANSIAMIESSDEEWSSEGGAASTPERAVSDEARPMEPELQEPGTRNDLYEVRIRPELRVERDADVEQICAEIIEAIPEGLALSRGRIIIVQRFGLDGDGPRTLDEVGRSFDVTRAYVGQVESATLQRLQRNRPLVIQVHQVLSRWIRDLADASPSGRLLTLRRLEQLLQNRDIIDGWLRLALEVGFPVSGPGAAMRRLIALADQSLHAFSPFGMPCWVTDRSRIDDTFPVIEAWVDELEGSPQALPMPIETLSGLLGATTDDVAAVLAAHPRFSVLSGYVFRADGSTASRRAVRAHILAKSLLEENDPIPLHRLWVEYRRRFEDVDPCSANDLRIAISDERGAPHLFILDNNKSVFALGDSATNHGLSLEPRFPDPVEEIARSEVGRLLAALTSGPQTADELAARCQMRLNDVISSLGQRPEVISVTPRLYGLAADSALVESIDWSTILISEEDAEELIACRQSGEVVDKIYLGWTREFEYALCRRADVERWRCLPRLLWACEPNSWPIPEAEKAQWKRRKSVEQRPPTSIASPSGNRLPDAERMLRFLLVLRRDGAISCIKANRVTRPRGPLETANGILLAIFARAGVLDGVASTFWSIHRAGPSIDRWYSILSEEYLQLGRLSWHSGACFELLKTACVSSGGGGWASGDDWSQRIRSCARGLGVSISTNADIALEASDTDEIRTSAIESNDSEVDVVTDLKSSARYDAMADVALIDPTETPVGVEFEQLIADVGSISPFSSTSENIDVLGAEVAHIDGAAALVSKANAGDSNAQYQLARQLEAGIATAPNLQAARHWLERAVDSGHVPASVRLGWMLFTGKVGDGTVAERQQGLVYLNVGTKVGNPFACYVLGTAYRKGDVVRKNPNAAFRLYKRAARAGHARAMLALAKMLHEHTGRWVPDAIRMVKRAAEKGVAEAADLLRMIPADS